MRPHLFVVLFAGIFLLAFVTQPIAAMNHQKSLFTIADDIQNLTSSSPILMDRFKSLLASRSPSFIHVDVFVDLFNATDTWLHQNTFSIMRLDHFLKKSEKTYRMDVQQLSQGRVLFECSNFEPCRIASVLNILNAERQELMKTRFIESRAKLLLELKRSLTPTIGEDTYRLQLFLSPNILDYDVELVQLLHSGTWESEFNPDLSLIILSANDVSSVSRLLSMLRSTLKVETQYFGSNVQVNQCSRNHCKSVLQSIFESVSIHFKKFTLRRVLDDVWNIYDLFELHFPNASRKAEFAVNKLYFDMLNQ